ncbi:MAG TPA: Crp/Fnr family transcriptional regulator [Bacteroidales bacterium]
MIEVSIKNMLGDYQYNPADIEIIASKFYPETIKKGAVFCERGKRINKVGILSKGLLLAYYENYQDEIEVSRYFDTVVNGIVVDFDAFVNQKPCSETIKAIEDSEMLCITRQDLYQLYKEVPAMNIIGRRLAEEGYVLAVRRIQALQTLDTEERFRRLYLANPTLFNRISKKDMATFLKMNRNLITQYLKKV